VSLPALRRLEGARRRAGPLPAAELEGLFAELLAEVRGLVGAVDAARAATSGGAA
jgi:hypothetical protein